MTPLAIALLIVSFLILLFLFYVGVAWFLRVQQRHLLKRQPLLMKAMETLDVPVADYFNGTWYEVAKLPNSFERGLDNITANYTLSPDQSHVTVINKGYDTKTGNIKKVKGVGFATDVKNAFEVQFFWPFRGSYDIVGYDKEKAVVASPDYKYLWFLSRSPLTSKTDPWFKDKAKVAGYTDDILAHVKWN